MARKNAESERIRIWFDAEGDYLEVRFSDKPGYMRETDNDALMERVDEQGHILGFSIMQVSRLSHDKPLTADLFSTAHRQCEEDRTLGHS